MAILRVEKVIASLPGTLTPNTIYMVRAGPGFDLHVTDDTGSIAYVSNVTLTGALAAINGLTPGEKDVMQYVGGAWVNRTMSQLATDLQTEIMRASRKAALIFGG